MTKLQPPVPLPLARLTRLLNPGPVLLLSTRGAAGPNLCTVAWSCPYDKDPPSFVLCLAEGHLSFTNLLEAGEAVLALPTVELLAQVGYVGSVSGREEDKWTRSGLTPLPLPGIGTPGVAECCANLGCRLREPELAQRTGLVLLEATVALGQPELLTAAGTVEVGRYRLLHHLGGDQFYVPDPRLHRLP